MKINTKRGRISSYRPDYDQIWRWFLIQGSFAAVILAIGVKVGWDVHEYHRLSKEAEERRELPVGIAKVKPEN